MSDSPDTARLLNRTLVPPTYLLHKLTYCVNWIISSFPVIGSFGMNSAKTIQFEGNDATKDDHDALKWFKKGAGGGNAFYIASLGTCIKRIVAWFSTGSKGIGRHAFIRSGS